jgi:hypothetical protein
MAPFRKSCKLIVRHLHAAHRKRPTPDESRQQNVDFRQMTGDPEGVAGKKVGL